MTAAATGVDQFAPKRNTQQMRFQTIIDGANILIANRTTTIKTYLPTGLPGKGMLSRTEKG